MFGQFLCCVSIRCQYLKFEYFGFHRTFLISEGRTVPLMKDGVIPDEMEESVKYDSSLDSFRSNSFDAISIYGFTIDDFDGGMILSQVTIQDGLRMVPKRNLITKMIHSESKKKPFQANGQAGQSAAVQDIVPVPDRAISFLPRAH